MRDSTQRIAMRGAHHDDDVVTGSDALTVQRDVFLRSVHDELHGTIVGVPRSAHRRKNANTSVASATDGSPLAAARIADHMTASTPLE